MSPTKFFNNLVLMENFLGIYRNYCKQNKTTKCFIIFLISAQALFHTIIAVYTLYLLLGEVHENQINLLFAGFSASAYLSSLTCVIAGVCYSRDFMSYYKGISHVFEYFKDDKKLMNSLKKTYRLSIGVIIYSFAFSVFRSVDTYLKFSELRPSILVPILLSQTMTRITILFQYLMLYCVVTIVVFLYKCLTSLILAAQERVRRCDLSSDDQVYITREQIQGWVDLYLDLANCCDKVMFCFGRQIGNAEEYTRAGIVLIGYVSVMMMPLFAGQKAKNQGVKFQRVLVRLYNTMHIDSGEAEGKMIKDFIRLIKKNPIQIKLLSKVPAGMYMLPVILSIAVNYLIIMLQFNHII